MKLFLHNKKIFIYSIVFCLIVVELFFLAQLIFVLKTFKPQYVVVPTLLGITIGILLGTVLAMRKQSRLQAEIFESIANQAGEFSFFRDLQGQFLYLSPSVKKLTGYSVAEFKHKHELLDEIIDPQDAAAWKRHLNEAYQQTHHPITFRIRHKDGDVRWIRHVCSTVRFDNNRIAGICSTNLEITEELSRKNKLENLANFDPLTSLPNRRYLKDHINSMIKQAHNDNTRIFAVMFVDLDHFKYINDTHGHSFGDHFLQLVADRLKRNCHENSIVSRFGGDEFVIVSPLLNDVNEASTLAHKVKELLSKPVQVNGLELYTSASIGISLYPKDGQDLEVLVQHADAAMYRSKEQGTGGIGFASDQLVIEASRSLDLDSVLRKAIGDKAFILHYQPKVDLQTRKYCGLEVLLRCQPEGKDIISPSHFIPYAEQTGLIVPIFDILFDKLCLQMKAWQDKQWNMPVSINLSGKQLNDPNCSKNIVETWQSHGLDNRLLEVEITESILMDKLEITFAHLEYFRSQGIKISIDDFGTGYSSLSYIRDLAADILKIDRSFINNIDKSEGDVSLARSIIALAESFGMETIAEGIETQDQLRILIELGCRKGQGFYFSKPVPAESFSAYLTGDKKIS